MTDRHQRQSPATRLALHSILGIGLMVVLAACGPTTPTLVTAGPSSVLSATPSAESSSPSSGASPAPPVGQSDTDWGRIWDAVPAGFPVYPGATPAGEAETGPVSAIYALEGADPKAIATWMQTELERATYRTEALSGPLEDGSFVLEMIGMTPDCRVEVVVAPLGGLVTTTVRYGAACPSP